MSFKLDLTCEELEQKYPSPTYRISDADTITFSNGGILLSREDEHLLSANKIGAERKTIESALPTNKRGVLKEFDQNHYAVFWRVLAGEYGKLKDKPQEELERIATIEKIFIERNLALFSRLFYTKEKEPKSLYFRTLEIGDGSLILDAIQESYFGLVAAAKYFDYRRGTKFSTLALHSMRQKVVACLEAEAKKGFAGVCRRGNKPALKLSPSDEKAMEETNPLRYMEQEETIQLVREAIGFLDEEKEKIIIARFFNPELQELREKGKEGSATLETVAKTVGLSRECIRRKILEAMDFLREELEYYFSLNA